MKATNKTRETDAAVDAFIATVVPDRRQGESSTLIDLFGQITGEPPRIWGANIIGFGSYDYKYESGREGSSLRTGFSPRKAKLSLYLMGAYCSPAAQAEQDRLLGLLGKHSLGKSCLYINRLDQVDLAILEQLIRHNWKLMNERYPT
jgi:hypothetical protein